MVPKYRQSKTAEKCSPAANQKYYRIESQSSKRTDITDIT